MHQKRKAKIPLIISRLGGSKNLTKNSTVNQLLTNALQ